MMSAADRAALSGQKDWPPPTRHALPTYADLVSRGQAPAGSAWGLFGDGDQIGTVNLLGSDAVLRAASLVRRGATFNLDYELSAFDPPVSPYRRALQHTVMSRHEGQVRDDFVNDLFPQASSQIDGLRHHRHRQYGFYGQVADSAVASGTPTLGIQHLADRGIVGRGVLLDVKHYLAASGRPLDQATQAISVKDLEATVGAQGVRF